MSSASFQSPIASTIRAAASASRPAAVWNRPFSSASDATLRSILPDSSIALAAILVPYVHGAVREPHFIERTRTHQLVGDAHDCAVGKRARLRERNGIACRERLG